MFKKTLIAALSATVASGAFAQSATDIQGILQQLETLNKQNEELRQKVLELEQKQVKQEADVAAVKTTVAATPPAASGAGLAKAPEKPGVAFKPYGWIKLDAVYDSARTAYGDAAMFVLPGTHASGGKEELTFGARETRLGAHILAPEHNGFKVAGRIEGDLYEDIATANKYSPRLRLAYLDAAWGDGWSLRFGQDWDTYIYFHPDTPDAAILGYTGHLYGRHPQIRLTKDTKLGDDTTLTLKVAAQHGRNGSALDTDGEPDENANPAPNLHASAALKTKLLNGQDSLFTLSGAYGREKLRGGVAHPGDYDSWLVHAGAQLGIAKPFSLQGVLWAGENLDNYLGGIGQGINVADGREVAAWGGWLQGVYKVTDSLRVGLGYGIDDPDDGDLSGDARTLNDRLFANVFYKLTDKVHLAAEYSYFRTDYAVSGDVIDNRFHFGAYYFF